MLNWSGCPAVESTPLKLGGEWVFRHSRVQVASLFANLEGGATVDEYLEWFPGIQRSQVNEVLEYAANSLRTTAA